MDVSRFEAFARLIRLSDAQATMIAAFLKVPMKGATSMLQLLEGNHSKPKLGVDREAIKGLFVPQNGG